jgi:hypothetical protein
MTTRSAQTINGIELHNKRPNEQTLQVHTPRFIISFPNDTNRVFYEIKDPSIQGEPFNVVLIMICYELSGHQLCRNIDFVSSFFTMIVLHLRSQIPKLLKYHKHIELIRKFFNEQSLTQYMVIPVNSFELEVHQNRTRFISKTSKKDSSYIRTKFEEYGTFLGDSCSQIASALSKMSVQTQAPAPALIEQKLENVWTQRQMKRSSGKESGTQMQSTNSSESATQTQTVSTCAKITQTDDLFEKVLIENAVLKKEIKLLQDLLKDNSDLKRKISQLEKRLSKSDSKSEEIPFTLKDHERFMKEQREIFEKEKDKLQEQNALLKEMNRKVIENGRAELKEFKNSSMEYFRKKMIDILSEYPITQSELGQILRISNPDNMVGPLSSWSMNVILQQFNRRIEKEERLSPSHFFEFWTDCILPKINESSPLILQTLKKEWERFRKMCRSSSDEKDFSLQVNLVFSQYIHDYKNEKYDRYVIPFFNILIHSCKNLIILVGLIDVYYGEKDVLTIPETIYEEFECIMTLPNPLVVLKEIVELSKQKLRQMEEIGQENPFPMPPIFNKLVYGVQLQSPSFFERLVESL